MNARGFAAGARAAADKPADLAESAELFSHAIERVV